MRIAARSRAEILAEAQERYREAVAKAPPPDFRNVEAVQELGGRPAFDYRGVRFTATPTPYADGVWFTVLLSKIEEAGKKKEPSPEALTANGEMIAEAVARFHRLATPARWWDRVRLRGRNPFADATWAEIGWLVGFFCACQTIAHVRHARRN